MLKVERVTKVYDPPRGLLRLAIRTASTDTVVALRSTSFEAVPGEVVGLVGPNGAGKSTLIRLCSSLLEPTSGRILVDGEDLAERPRTARSITGLQMTDERSLYWRLTGRENLRFFGVMAGLSASHATSRADELLRRFDLDRRDGRVFGYSSGMRVRLGLARALMADPQLLILDEPSRSLDPVASASLHRQLRSLADDGSTVVLSSHRLDEVETVCDRVLVLIGGEQRAWATMDELTGHAGSAAASLRRMLEAEPNQ